MRTQVTAVLLAAGSSRRFGGDNKLLEEIDGETLVARVAEALLASKVGAVLVVTPTDPAAISRALARSISHHSGRLSMVPNADASRGIASSIATGIAAVPAGASGAMIVPADMPGLTAAVCDALLSAFVASGHEALVHAMTTDHRQRNPVIWPRRLFPRLLALEGDVGGKSVIGAERQARPETVVGVVFEAASAFLDVDVPADLARWR